MPFAPCLPLLSALPLLGALFQAEAAPPEPPPAGPPLAPLLAAPFAPEPEPSSPPLAPAPPPPLTTTAGLTIGLGQRLGTAATDIPPAFGIAFATAVRQRFPLAANWIDLGIEGHFFFDRYSRTVQGSVPIGSGTETPFDDIRSISHFDFSALQTVAIPLLPFRPWVGAGGGIGLAYFSTHEAALRPGESRLLSPILRGAVGLDFSVQREFDVGVRVDYVHLLRASTFVTQGSDHLTVFGDRLAFSICFLYRF